MNPRPSVARNKRDALTSKPSHEGYEGGLIREPDKDGRESIRPLTVKKRTLLVGEQEIKAEILPKGRQKIMRREVGKGGPAAGSNFAHHAAHLTEVVLLGNIAIRTKEKLAWDGPAMRFTNSEEANKLLNPPYRAGWSL